MNVDVAARRLSERIQAPPEMVTVLAWHGDDGQEIRVWLAGAWEDRASSLPTEFMGFPVVTDRRPTFVPHSRR